jgi:tRNA(Ile)-lysidine synthase
MKSPKLLRSIEIVIKENGLLEPGAKVLIGVSGGPDSMALLSLLSELRPKWRFDLTVLYCHHGLRAAADEEKSFVRNWSKKFGHPFVSRRLGVRIHQRETGKSLQEAARDLRYRIFEDYLAKDSFDRVALAHTANDQAEEVLIGLIRGAGLGGLTGMALRRGPFIRPLLRTSRPEILHYLTFKNIPFKEDASNKDLHYLRARVRHHLLEELKYYSPNIIQQLNQTAGLLQKDEEYLQKKAAELAAVIVTSSGRTARFHRQKLRSLPQALVSRIFLKVLLEGMGDLRHIRAVHILSLLKAATGPGEKGQMPLPNGWSAQWNRQTLTILPSVPKSHDVAFFNYEINKPQRLDIVETGDFLSLKKVKAPSSYFQPPTQNNQAKVDFDKLSWPLKIRNVRPGDRFNPLGLNGIKKVSRFFIDRKIPQDLRSRIPLIFSKGEIVWIAGMGIGHPFRLDSNSNWALEMTYGKGKE